ncbi:RNA polymerase primary sigma factor [Anaerocolumna jejuensis DSM 15929]|uniref:RNA polymerase primary sigma factor n=1 Tax=Anaerocolumna jejuensis DSM 15929 TaxID=1121322 RepID=A0A1M6XT26_9FIRM|nr:sigma factor [Anaerocolumna jejuensis]SHL09058.1 RNA polymerase primary sigma factor [Anaerocolumna jejuensis DSM 15929]
MEGKDKFQEMLKDVLEVARVQGNELGMNEIKELFGDMGLSEEQYEHIFAYLAAAHITVKGYVKTKVFEEYKEAPREKEEEDQSQEPAAEEELQPADDVALQEEERKEQLREKNSAQNVDSQYLKMYLKDLEAVKEADEAELTLLFQAVREKKDSVKERFIEVHLPKVIEIAKLYQNRGVTLEDLIQEGNIGLLCAVETLYTDTVLENETEFIEGYVRNSMEQIIYENGESSSFEQEIIDKISYIRKASENLKEELGREGNIHELARYVKISEEELIDIINMSVDGVKLSKKHD